MNTFLLVFFKEMGMLYLIGIGLKTEHLTVEAKNALAECEEVYLENYTSKYSEGDAEGLRGIIGKEITELGRKQVEEEFSAILETAKTKKVALLIYGNVFSATTHIQIVKDAKEKGVEVRSVPGISIFSFLGKTGLEEYKFGRTVSIVFWEENYQPEMFYEKILDNYKIGMHTLCLLDIQGDKLMSVKEALEVLKKVSEKKTHKFLDTFLLCALSKVGSAEEKIVFGKMDELLKMEFDVPSALIVCAELNEKEKELVEGLYGYRG